MYFFPAGSSLNSAAAFTIFSVFNAMQFTVGVLPFTVRSIAEAKISLTRIQVSSDLTCYLDTGKERKDYKDRERKEKERKKDRKGKKER